MASKCTLCCTTAPHSYSIPNERDTRTIRSSTRHHPRDELLDTMRARTTRFCSPTTASLSTRDHQRHQPTRTRTHSELVGGGGRSCLRAVRLGVVLSCVLLSSAPASRETSELQLSPPGGEEKEQNGSRNGDKLTNRVWYRCFDQRIQQERQSSLTLTHLNQLASLARASFSLSLSPCVSLSLSLSVCASGRHYQRRLLICLLACSSLLARLVLPLLVVVDLVDGFFSRQLTCRMALVAAGLVVHRGDDDVGSLGR